MEQRIVISENLQKDIAIAISECEHDKVFVLVDETTEKTCWPLINTFFSVEITWRRWCNTPFVLD